MNRFWTYLVLGLGIFAIGLGTGLGVTSHRASKKAQAAQAQADQAAGAAKTHAAEAAASDLQATKDQATITGADAKTAAARRELDRRLAALPKPAAASNPSLPVVPDELIATRAALAQAQVVIADKDAQLAARDRLIASITASRDSWKATAEDREKELALQKIASDAAVHSEHVSGIKSQLVHVGEAAFAAYLVGKASR